MSDILVALPPVTNGQCVMVAKNADRPVTEVQEVIYVPAADYPPGSKLKCTFVEVEQVSHTEAVVLSKAAWTWGAEMGANSAGVVAACTAVWTKLCRPGDHQDRLLGVDLVRLGLERSQSARQALDIITGLISSQGQGGLCCEDHNFGQWTYHCSFLVADRTEAWLIETADKFWVAKRFSEGVLAVSCALSLGTDFDLSSPGLQEEAQKEGVWSPDTGPLHFTKTFSAEFSGLSLSNSQLPSHRLQAAKSMLDNCAKNGDMTCTDMFTILRDRPSSINSTGELITMASSVSVLQPPGSDKPDVHWLTGTPDPALSIFKPFIFHLSAVIGAATVSPEHAEQRPVQGQPLPDRRHSLFKYQEVARKVIDGGSEHGKQLEETMAMLEANCVRDLAAFLEDFNPDKMQEVAELFKDLVESEIKFYK